MLERGPLSSDGKLGQYLQSDRGSEVRYAEMPEHARAMDFDCAHTDTKRARDVFVGIACSKQGKHLALPHAQCCDPL